jgi:Cys/Met metabolism PLP-dependent enzyme
MTGPKGPRPRDAALRHSSQSLSHRLPTCPADAGALEYLSGLVNGLLREVTNHKTRLPESHVRQVRALYRHFTSDRRRLATFRSWHTLWLRYQKLSKLTGSLLNVTGTVATVYKSMDCFWADLSEQELGRSTGTVWDTYEHGRRRQLELLCATTYESEAALLLNSGMAALFCALWSAQPSPGSTILTGQRSYFETSELLLHWFRGLNLTTIRVEVDRPGEVVRALHSLRPAIALFETATNLPGSAAPPDCDHWRRASPETLFIVDNSVQGALTRWSRFSGELQERLVVVESGVKYMTENCMAGLLYGSRSIVERCRSFARVAGLLLQECAFNYLREAEIASLPDRLDLHSRNASAFAWRVRQRARPAARVGQVGDCSGRRNRATGLFAKGIGAPVFIELCSRTESGSAHRKLLDSWRTKARHVGIPVPIRAGFGWPQTTARVYESGILNQPDAPAYLRVSVGIEPLPIIEALADLLAATCQECRPGRNDT